MTAEPATLDIVLRNDTGAAQLYAHITGSDNAGLVLIGADGKSAYRPVSPASTLQPLGADCSILVGGPGSSRRVQVPRMAGARIWFCKDRALTFFVNPGPALVEPSATNPTDPNYNVDWGFCEFTWNQQELYVNVSFVDFVGLPISLRLATGDGRVKTVPGLPSDGLQTVCGKLEEQARRDGKGWDKLVVRDKGSGRPLRALSPNAGGVLAPGLFGGYYQAYVDAVWVKYAGEDLTVDTQFKWGRVKGRVNGADGKLTFAGSGKAGSSGGTFGKPSAADIFSCSTGPFAGGAGVTEEQLNIGARLAAALNRSTLLGNADQPEGEKVETYYQQPVTNHFARICHETSVEGRGYAFPYDDVGPAGGKDQSGFVNDPNPKELTVCVGRPLTE
ncbi:beta-1,3-glucanase domain-containing protein [Hirsutella rhossiliensis]|uniref:Beta-1,3-glucanase domain-containing protein n=1 Tax=Hirsutella rhossiliensis TaxID=111463 RepID=A0A9P8SFA4_9HYPO|nr:beta-1,3-glucanase domain-containing protein [Hirsutella rhossiliensis]KAH0960541.1 beta-1,3-glucanase domain-containing protein [Hirsutella rhossiliensis]